MKFQTQRPRDPQDKGIVLSLRNPKPYHTMRTLQMNSTNRFTIMFG